MSKPKMRSILQNDWSAHFKNVNVITSKKDQGTIPDEGELKRQVNSLVCRILNWFLG